MFELILHHQYNLLGEAIDLSPAANHGAVRNVQFLPDGRAPHSGALQFSQPNGRVRVRDAAVWGRLHALKIEAWLKLDVLGRRRNIVEGDGSFAFFIHPDGVLWGTFYAPTVPGGPRIWHGANSATYSPDSQIRTVPLGDWVKLTYVHDGVASLRLFINDQLVAANYNLISSVPAVHSLGVHIGNWPAGDLYPFAGEIDEVKIWRYDRDAAYKQFLCRPMDSSAMACWVDVFNLIATRASDPHRREQLAGLMRCLRDAQQQLIRAVRARGEVAISECQYFARKYRELWCEGRANSMEMRELLEEWLKWLRESVGAELMHSYLETIKECWGQFGWEVKFEKDLAECDPDFAEYLETFTALM